MSIQCRTVVLTAQSSGLAGWLLPDTHIPVAKYVDAVLALPLARCSQALSVAPFPPNNSAILDQAETRIAGVSRCQAGAKASV